MTTRRQQRTAIHRCGRISVGLVLLLVLFIGAASAAGYCWSLLQRSEAAHEQTRHQLTESELQIATVQDDLKQASDQSAELSEQLQQSQTDSAALQQQLDREKQTIATLNERMNLRRAEHAELSWDAKGLELFYETLWGSIRRAVEVDELTSMLAAIEKRFPTAHRRASTYRRAEDYKRIAGLFESLGANDRALEYRKKVIDVYREDEQATAKQYYDAYGRVARQQLYLLQLADVLQTRQQRYQKMLEEHGEGAKALIAPYRNIITLHEVLGDFETAAEMRETEFQLTVQHYGEDSPAWRYTMRSWAEDFLRLGRYDDAEAALQRVASYEQAGEKPYSGDHFDTRAFLVLIALTRNPDKQPAELPRLIEDAQFLEQLGARHRSEYYGRLLIALGRFAEARPYVESWHHQRGRSPQRPFEYLRALNAMVVCLNGVGDEIAAQPHVDALAELHTAIAAESP